MRLSRRAFSFMCVTMLAACSGGHVSGASDASPAGRGKDGSAAADSGDAAGADTGRGMDGPPVTARTDAAVGRGGAPAERDPDDAGVAAPEGSRNWPMFGRDYANSRASSDVSIGAEALAKLRVAQRVSGAGVSSTPAIVDGVAYLSDYAGWLKAEDALA